MQQFYDSKNILITGATGFLGKVILEKILRVFNCKVFVLIRQKKGSALTERLTKEIYESPILDQIRRQHTNFEQYFFSRVIPIAGDLLAPQLGLSNDDHSKLCNEIHLFIHCAASVDFNAPITDALQINILGTLKAYDLYQQCKQGLNFVHVSTCYVNCDMTGFIQERIHDKGIDPYQHLKMLVDLKKSDITDDLTKTIIQGYPNTYTYTKYIAERLLQSKYKGGSLCIVRPAIIGSSYREPVEGWVDNVSAAGALFLLGGLGVVSHVKGDPENIGDLIPVDYVSDYILVATYYGSIKEGFHVMHSSSSELNPVTWGTCSDVVVKYWRENPPQKKFAPCNFKIYKSATKLKVNEIKRKLPWLVYEKLATLSNNQNMLKNAKRVQKIFKRSTMVSSTFQHFTQNQWIYQSEKIHELHAMLTPEERKLFQMNLKDIDWVFYLTHFAWGLHKFVLQEKIDPPSYSKRFNLKSSQQFRTHYSDLQWVLDKGSMNGNLFRKEIIDRILSSQEVASALKQHGPEASEWARKRCNSMFGDYNNRMVKFGALLVHKFFKQIFDKIVVDQQIIHHLKELDRKGSLILAPNHTSYIDIVIIAYIFYAYKIGGIFFNCSEDLSRVQFLGQLFRMCGAFFLDLKKPKNKVHQELQGLIMAQYLKILIFSNRNLELFVEGSRTRSGKLTGCKNPIFDLMASECIKGNYQNKIINVVPVSIKYERVVESESFTLQLLGEHRRQASIKHLLESAPLLKQDFGRIFVEFMPEINLQSFCEDKLQSRLENTHLLGKTIINSIRQSAVILPTSIVSSILLMNRGGISEEQLVQQSSCFTDHLQKRQKFVGSLSAVNPSSLQPIKTIQLMGGLVTKRKDMFSLMVTPKVDYKNILLLAYYRNSLLNTIFDECVASVAIISFGIHTAFQEGVEYSRLIEETSFLQKILQFETVEFDQPEIVLQKMMSMGTIQMQGSKVKAIDQKLIHYFCTMVWSFVDTYYVSLGYLFKLKGESKQDLIMNIQYFAESLYFERVIDHYECSLKETVGHSLKLFKHLNLIGKEGQKIQLKCDIETLNDLEQHLQRFLKHSYAKSINSLLHVMQNVPSMQFKAKL